MTSVPLRLHTVLLALAGRIDDGALGHARQLSAAARVDEAGELIAGTLIAGGIPLRPSERREFGEVLTASGADVALLDQLIVSEHDVEPPHGFSAEDQPDAGVAEAIEPIKAALTDVRSIHAAWRTTAAGRVPGQVPQRVVLIELGARGSAPATAHLVAAALRDAGIRTAVEVASADVPWTNYHQHALAAAVAVVDGKASAPVREVPGQKQAPAPSQEPAPERAAVSERPAESAGFFAAKKPAFAAQSAPEYSNGHGESAPAHAVATSTAAATGTSTPANGTNETSAHTTPPRTNGHHRAPEQASQSFWPQPQPVAEQPAEPPRAERTAAPAPTGHAVEPPRNDHADESPRGYQAAETPRADHGVEPPRHEPPRQENSFAPPRADYPGASPRNGHSVEPNADRPAGPSRHEAVEPPRADRVTGLQSNGNAPEPPRNSHAAEPFHNAQPAEPRNGYPEPPRNGHHAQPPHNGHPAEPPRADPAAEPPRNDYPAEPPNHGGNNVVNFPESEAESTAEMSRNDAQQLHQALREAEAADRGAPQAHQPPQPPPPPQPPQREAVELPAADAEAQLSDRDRELLRELHAELAKREREQSAQVQLNGWHRPGS
ncbi:hypothetical protein [Haloechinothrix halophila]|uniref:hypothetical protein n=1 Tax=Haloechinothrix halophila TaxID=1069073 RepID=UPI00068752FD|nr:hypothetical protein [Haloechinothrix halophila]